MYVLSRIGFGTDVMRSPWVERSRTITAWCADRLTALLTATLTAVLTDSRGPVDWKGSVKATRETVPLPSSLTARRRPRSRLACYG